MSVSADLLRSLVGQEVRLRLTAAGGGGDLTGTVSRTLESADGLIVFLADQRGTVHNVHYQHIETAERAELTNS